MSSAGDAADFLYWPENAQWLTRLRHLIAFGQLPSEADCPRLVKGFIGCNLITDLTHF